MTIVSNSSPLIGLARLRRLDLLRALYGEILVPDAVWREVVLEGPEHPGGAEVETSTWIRRRSVANRPLVQALQRHLGAGEAEAIALALEARAELLLMDDRMGRRAARRLGIRTLGLAGVLLEAKAKGLVPAVKPFLDELRDLAGFRLGDEVYAQVLREAKEGSS